MSRNYEANDLVEVVVDEYSSAILTATSAEPVVVDEIVDEVGMSPATAYRRIGQLVDFELLEERTWLDDDGNQARVYESRFESVKIEIINGIAYLHIVRDETHDLTRVWDFQ